MKADWVLHHTDFVYTRMQAHVWSANGLVLPTTLQADAGKSIARVLAETEPSKPIVIDCKGMTAVDDHASAPLADAYNNCRRPLVFANAAQLMPVLTRKFRGASSTYSTDGQSDIVVYGNPEPRREECKAMVASVPSLQSKFVSERIRACFRAHAKPERLTSTPLMATGIFNARTLITDPVSFVWLCLLMAEKFNELMQADRPLSPRLFAVSLRASPFAAAIQLLNRGAPPIEIIDHMGPRHKILEEHSLKGPTHGISYIFVGDFVVGGTELRVADAYAHRSGSTVTHAVVLGTVLAPQEYSASIKLIPLLSERLTDCCKEAEFYFDQKPSSTR